MIGIIGILTLLALAWGMSKNREAIAWRTVIAGLCVQVMLAVFILNMPLGQWLFSRLGSGVEHLLGFADQAGGFVFGAMVSQPETMVELFGPGGDFIFALTLIPAIIFVATLVQIAYHLGVMQWIVKGIAWVVYRLLGVSGAEALSNTASVFVGQVEAQLLVKPYIKDMTMSELLTVMAGSMACIAGAIMAVYIKMGIPAEYLMAASLMAIPGAMVIAKIVWPETEKPVTKGDVEIKLESTSVNVIDAAAQGAAEGMKIGIAVIAMLIGFLAMIYLIDGVLVQVGHGLGNLFFGAGNPAIFASVDLHALSLNTLFGLVFGPMAALLGVPWADAATVGGLMGTKLAVNEFVAYSQLGPIIKTLDPKSVTIATFALCGFANFASVAIQIGGIGEMAPSRKADLARLGLLAMLCGTMASYLSAAIAGMLTTIAQSSGSGTGMDPLSWAIFAAAFIGLVWVNKGFGMFKTSGSQVRQAG